MSLPSAIGTQASRFARELPLLGGRSTIPRILYGTAWKKEKTADLVYKALRAGFRGIDTAAQPKHYDEAAVARGVRRALTEGLVKREDIFIQTKFTGPGGQNESMPYDPNAPLADKVRQSVQSSLDRFTFDGQEPYLDCVVLHSPMRTMKETMAVWKTLESFTPHRVRNLGISNATLDVVRALWDDEQTLVKPAVLQNRFYAENSFANDLRWFCQDRGLVFQSFWTLTANPFLLRSEVVTDAARCLGVQREVAFYALVLTLGNITILDGTTTELHMRQDVAGIEHLASWIEENAVAWEPIKKKFETELMG